MVLHPRHYGAAEQAGGSDRQHRYDNDQRERQFQLGQAGLHIILNCFFLRENQFVVFAADIKNSHTDWLIDQGTEFLQNLIFICS